MPGSKNKMEYNQNLVNSKEHDAQKLKANECLLPTKLKLHFQTLDSRVFF